MAYDLSARPVIFHRLLDWQHLAFTLFCVGWHDHLQTGDKHVINLFDDIPARADNEIFTEVLSRKNVRIERIVSTGHFTPADRPYRQQYDEWVLLLAGSAGLRIEGEDERNLRPGDHVLIAAHRAHWVTFTAKDEPTIWLAVRFG